MVTSAHTHVCQSAFSCAMARFPQYGYHSKQRACGAMLEELCDGRFGTERGQTSEAGRFRAAGAVVRHNLTGQAGIRARRADMKPVVHLALAGDNGSRRSAQLLEYRNAEGAPEQITVVIGK